MSPKDKTITLLIIAIIVIISAYIIVIPRLEPNSNELIEYDVNIVVRDWSSREPLEGVQITFKTIHKEGVLNVNGQTDSEGKMSIKLRSDLTYIITARYGNYSMTSPESLTNEEGSPVDMTVWYLSKFVEAQYRFLFYPEYKNF